MVGLRSTLRFLGLPRLLHPLRGPITWACQRGVLSPAMRRVLPGSWEQEPFAVYGQGWQCRWFPTQFDHVGHWIFWHGVARWEIGTPDILEQIRRSRCFVDAGAHTGLYSVVGCAIQPDLRVVAVEPVPRICAALSNNIARNGFQSRVTVVNAALTDSNGTVSFHQADDSTMGSLAIHGYRGQRGRVIQVECRTLDSLAEELQIQPDFVKIDVEGFEHVVLGGACRVLREFRPRIVLESNPGDAAGEVTRILSQHGYTFANLTDGGPQRRSQIVAVEAYPNWLCMPS